MSKASSGSVRSGVNAKLIHHHRVLNVYYRMQYKYECYCGQGLTAQRSVMLQCNTCMNWFHKNCVAAASEHTLWPGDVAYYFQCKSCIIEQRKEDTPDQIEYNKKNGKNEIFQRYPKSWNEVVRDTIYHLCLQSNDDTMHTYSFDKDKENKYRKMQLKKMERENQENNYNDEDHESSGDDSSEEEPEPEVVPIISKPTSKKGKKDASAARSKAAKERKERKNKDSPDFFPTGLHWRYDICHFIDKNWSSMCYGKIRMPTWWLSVSTQLNTNPIQLFYRLHDGRWSLQLAKKTTVKFYPRVYVSDYPYDITDASVAKLIEDGFDIFQDVDCDDGEVDEDEEEADEAGKKKMKSAVIHDEKKKRMSVMQILGRCYETGVDSLLFKRDRDVALYSDDDDDVDAKKVNEDDDDEDDDGRKHDFSDVFEKRMRKLFRSVRMGVRRVKDRRANHLHWGRRIVVEGDLRIVGGDNQMLDEGQSQRERARERGRARLKDRPGKGRSRGGDSRDGILAQPNVNIKQLQRKKEEEEEMRMREAEKNLIPPIILPYFNKIYADKEVDTNSATLLLSKNSVLAKIDLSNILTYRNWQEILTSHQRSQLLQYLPSSHKQQATLKKLLIPKGDDTRFERAVCEFQHQLMTGALDKSAVWKEKRAQELEIKNVKNITNPANFYIQKVPELDAKLFGLKVYSDEEEDDEAVDKDAQTYYGDELVMLKRKKNVPAYVKTVRTPPRRNSIKKGDAKEKTKSWFDDAQDADAQVAAINALAASNGYTDFNIEDDYCDEWKPSDRPESPVGVLNCTCETPYEDAEGYKGDLMVKCSYCSDWVHGICFGWATESELPEVFKCLRCEHRDLYGDNIPFPMEAAVQLAIANYNHVVENPDNLEDAVILPLPTVPQNMDIA